ncbi:MAG: SRPBCC family protein [Ilumatobacteraceae bacterium]
MNTTSNRHGSAVVTLPSDTTILITRQFDAPAAGVFRALTTPELVKRWWGFDTSEWQVCDIDLRVGGAWRYVMVANQGFEVAFHGEYREIVPTERIVSTEAYEGVPDPDGTATLVTCTFDETDGRTTLTQLVECHTQEIRDMILDSGMEGGMQEAMDALERVAVELV